MTSYCICVVLYCNKGEKMGIETLSCIGTSQNITLKLSCLFSTDIVQLQLLHRGYRNCLC